jgi:hypothetical protein
VGLGGYGVEVIAYKGSPLLSNRMIALNIHEYVLELVISNPPLGYMYTCM